MSSSQHQELGDLHIDTLATFTLQEKSKKKKKVFKDQYELSQSDLVSLLHKKPSFGLYTHSHHNEK